MRDYYGIYEMGDWDERYATFTGIVVKKDDSWGVCRMLKFISESKRYRDIILARLFRPFTINDNTNVAFAKKVEENQTQVLLKFTQDFADTMYSILKLENFKKEIAQEFGGIISFVENMLKKSVKIVGTYDYWPTYNLVNTETDFIPLSEIERIACAILFEKGDDREITYMAKPIYFGKDGNMHPILDAMAEFSKHD